MNTNNTRKSHTVIVLAANLALSMLIVFAIWVGNNNSRHDSGGVKKVDVPKAQVDSSPPAETPAGKAKKDPGAYPATAHGEAARQPGQQAGRQDPTTPTSYAAPYPGKKAGTRDEKLTAAPLHNATAHSPDKPSLPRQEVVALPPPPDPEPVRRGRRPSPVFGYVPPSKLAGITVTAVIGNKAMLKLRRQGAGRHDKPEVVCLAAGEQVKTANNVPVSVIAVEPYRVTLEVDGERFVKSLPEIR